MQSKREMRTFCKTLWEDEDGAIGILLTAMLPVVAGFTTLAVDMSYVWMLQNQLQITADAAALAGTIWMATTAQRRPTRRARDRRERQERPARLRRGPRAASPWCAMLRSWSRRPTRLRALT